MFSFTKSRSRLRIKNSWSRTWSRPKTGRLQNPGWDSVHNMELENPCGRTDLLNGRYFKRGIIIEMLNYTEVLEKKKLKLIFNKVQTPFTMVTSLVLDTKCAINAVNRNRICYATGCYARTAYKMKTGQNNELFLILFIFCFKVLFYTCIGYPS